MSEGRPRRAPAAAAAVVLLVLASPARAVVLGEDELGERSTDLGACVRSFAFWLAGDVLAPPLSLSDENPTGIGVFDARLVFAHRSPGFKLALHAPLTASVRSHAGTAAIPLGRGASPPRWLPLEHRLTEEPTLDLRASIDWLYVAVSPGPLTLTAGRQPLSFGRGQIWRPTDRISSFALTEIDKEYRPGADALRLDWSMAEQSTLTLLLVGGEIEPAGQPEQVDLEATGRGSSLLGRFAQGWSRGEIGAMAGLVRGDLWGSIDAVLDAAAFDAYAELTLTLLSDQSLGSPAIEDRALPVPSALVGATFKPISTLTLVPELYLNGFGATEPAGYLRIALSERVAVGEQVALGQLYGGLSADWQLHPLAHLVSAAIANLTDPSALVLLSLSYELAANAVVVVGGYLPVGSRPVRAAGILPELRSEYGSYPSFAFLELKGAI
ncbi:MAG: hypothetical protein HY744_23490 [Deltaproteobacteria bacterium]|nr:hypothetical protein [Deltaproteobacteria bacterium]